MYNIQSILSNRESRSQAVAKAALSSDIITVKANIPGGDKRIRESFLIVRYFTNRVLEEFGGKVKFYDGADGICAVISVSGERLKERAVEIEKSDPIGRFTDIDVYSKGESHSLSRGYMRKCYICENAAFICARQGTHTVEELLDTIKSSTRKFFFERIAVILKDSLMAELNLENKFGLVTPASNGSHGDLNYTIMQTAQDAIIPYLVRLFWTGFYFDSTEGLLEKLRPIGQEAEKAMYSAVGGANAYKGFIFVAGVLLASTGYILSAGGEYEEIFSTAGKVCRGITAELKSSGADESFGIKAYKEYGITGVRGHAENGFSVVREAEKLIDCEYSSESLLKVLCYIVGNIEDTVLLKRSGSVQRYKYFKDRIYSADITDKQQIKRLNEECINNGISIGGSADVLAAAVLLKKLRALFYFHV